MQDSLFFINTIIKIQVIMTINVLISKQLLEIYHTKVDEYISYTIHT